MSSDLAWTRERLRNFGRWSRMTGSGPATCYSAEGRYQPERLSEVDEEERRTPRSIVDELDAAKVFEAMLPIYGFPRGLVYVLWGVYVWRYKGEKLRAYLRQKGMRVRGRDVENLVHEAELAVQVRLERLDRRETGLV